MDNFTFMTKDSTPPAAMPYCNFLLQSDLSETSRLIFTILLFRALISQKNGWIDEQGRVFVLYTLEHLSAASGKSISTVKASLAALETHNLIVRETQQGRESRRIFIKLPTPAQTLPIPSDKKLATKENSNNINFKNNYSCSQEAGYIRKDGKSL